MDEKYISINFEKNEVKPEEELKGVIDINYLSRFDTIVINSHIENSNDIFNFINLNGKKINYPYARMSILKQDIKERKKIEFTTMTKHIPPGISNVKFRVSIIQEHKEVANDTFFLKIRS